MKNKKSPFKNRIKGFYIKSTELHKNRFKDNEEDLQDDGHSKENDQNLKNSEEEEDLS